MNKKAFMLCALIICIAFQAIAFAERESASYSIDIVFGGERFTNVFNVEWDTDEVYQPYGYGITPGDRQMVIRGGMELSSPTIAIIKGEYPYRIVGHYRVDTHNTDEIIVTVDGETYRGFINLMGDTSALEYRNAGGILKESDLQPQGMIVFPKGSEYDTFYFPEENAIWDQNYGAGKDLYFEYVEVYDGWYKTAHGKWYKDNEIHQLTIQEISELYGTNNPILFRYGDVDPIIGQVQEKLSISITNELDDITRGRLANYQYNNGLLDSGLIDQDTYDALMK